MVKMPPLTIQPLKTLSLENFFQQVSIVINVSTQPGSPAKGAVGKFIGGAAHIQVPPALIHNRDVDGSASIVSGPGSGIRNISPVGDGSPEEFLHREGSVTLEKLEAKAAGSQSLVGPNHRLGNLSRQEAPAVLVNRLAQNVVRACHSQVNNNCGIKFLHIEQPGCFGFPTNGLVQSPLAPRNSGIGRSRKRTGFGFAETETGKPRQE